MERIDKIISNQLGYSRKDVQRLIKDKRVKVNNNIISKKDLKIDYNKDTILIDNKELIVEKYIYLILNKPKGYISATEDNYNKTVLDLVPSKYLHRNLFPVGRLDKDTTGLLIITDDGIFAHEKLSPKKHVEKRYLVTINIPITDNMIEEFKRGVKIQEEICKPSLLEVIDNNTGIVTLTEGKYHQIKRMFEIFNAKVIELKRISMGNLNLPSDLLEGECRILTEEELNKI